MPEIKALQAEKGLDSLAVLAVNAGETKAQAEEFIDFLDAPFAYGFDPGLVLSDAYGVFGLPVSVFLDANGVVQAVYHGHADRARLEAYVDAAIAARPAPPLPLQLRPVSTLPRERVLHVESRGGDEIVFTSRALRCDAMYCADEAVAALRSSPGIIAAARSSSTQDEPALTVRFDPAATSEEAVISSLVSMLRSLQDPVYEQDLEVRRKRP
jgi:hypothetical protein